MVKRMSTPDIYVAYYAFTWRVYGFLAGCKGMRRKNAGANDSWVDRRCVRRHKFVSPAFSFLSPPSSSNTNSKRHLDGKEGGCSSLDEAKRRIHVGNFSYCSVSRIFDRFVVLENGDFQLRRWNTKRRELSKELERYMIEDLMRDIFFSRRKFTYPPSRQFEFPISPLWNGRWNGRYGNFNFKFNFEFIASINTKFKLQ